MRLKIFEKLRTARLNSEFIGYKKVYYFLGKWSCSFCYY